MTPGWLKALKLSIIKWKKIKADKTITQIGQCPLCDYGDSLIGSPAFESSCTYCPVARKTQAAQCKNTPYYEVRDAIQEPSRPFPEEGINEMIAILESCLEE